MIIILSFVRISTFCFFLLFDRKLTGKFRIFFSQNHKRNFFSFFNFTVIEKEKKTTLCCGLPVVLVQEFDGMMTKKILCDTHKFYFFFFNKGFYTHMYTNFVGTRTDFFSLQNVVQKK